MHKTKCLRTFIVLVATIAVLAGCASTTEMGLTTLNSGNLDAAERLFKRAIDEGEPTGWNNLGVVYMRRGLRERAIQHFTVAARYGVPIAQRNLAELGQPVPSVDLAPANASADSGWLLQALLVGATSYQQGRNSVAPQPQPQVRLGPAAPSPPVRCVTKQNATTKAWETVCQ